MHELNLISHRAAKEHPLVLRTRRPHTRNAILVAVLLAAPTLASEPRVTDPMLRSTVALPMLSSLIIALVLLIGGAGLFAYYRRDCLTQSVDSNWRLTVLQRVALDRQTSLAVVRFGRATLLLGTGGGRAAVLSERIEPPNATSSSAVVGLVPPATEGQDNTPTEMSREVA